MSEKWAMLFLWKDLYFCIQRTNLISNKSYFNLCYREAKVSSLRGQVENIHRVYVYRAIHCIQIKWITLHVKNTILYKCDSWNQSQVTKGLGECPFLDLHLSLSALNYGNYQIIMLHFIVSGNFKETLHKT